MLDVTQILIAMAQKRVNRGELAKLAGLGDYTITRVLAGKDTTISTLYKIAEALEADPRGFILPEPRYLSRSGSPA